MKCDMIRDLLPLYIDGLTSEESNKEIEKHLKSCKECRICYQEMTGEINHAAPISEEEIQDVRMIKNIKKKSKRRMTGILIGTLSIICILGMFVISQSFSRVKYEEVQLAYGVRGDMAYCIIESKPGYELHFAGSSGGKESHLKVLSTRRVGDSRADKMEWENEVGTEENPCRWTIEFQDKTIVIENGKLVDSHAAS